MGNKTESFVDSYGDLELDAPGLAALSDEMAILLEAGILCYYSDLVLPAMAIEPKGAKAHTSTAASGRSLSRSQIPLPRGARSTSDNEESHRSESGPRQGSFVAPHRRLLPEGWHASREQVREAAIAGVSLRDAVTGSMEYTFVRGHARGEGVDKGVYKHSESHLVLSDFLSTTLVEP